MATQEGIVPIKGTIGNLTFFKTASGGFRVRARNVVSAKKVAKSRKYIRTRENLAEFNNAAGAGSLIRKAFAPITAKAKDGKTFSRLVGELRKVVVSDGTSDRGQRNVADGNAALLTGFEFNGSTALSTTLMAPYTAVLDRVTGNASIDVPAFVPEDLAELPEGGTHFRLFMGVAAIDFAANTFEVDTAESTDLVYGNTATPAISLKANIKANSPDPLFLAFGIAYMQQINGKIYSLNNGSFNACSLVKVEMV